ncbi:hypothetical protein CWATWH8502_517 [Crocosphaera watsonii WH 8502]|uniref:Uncharacterized protein n=2 Tax=Crocosphaera watsonii TaxID=263511 RepID=T2J5T6_CROWT|nr:hypothetical protein CWATWH8502_517 [Crocosphaera watsonii WH 8502]CCQ60364.1 hypothetical protein CWATWH0401_1585 [Crocosphaera watsonii WH 0401]
MVTNTEYSAKTYGHSVFSGMFAENNFYYFLWKNIGRNSL